MTMRPATAEENEMEAYTALRHFADSWALLGMTLFFLGVVLFTLRPGSKSHANEAAQIPLKED
jgi:cytochrome c oxidase cbb3-type subunit 4